MEDGYAIDARIESLLRQSRVFTRTESYAKARESGILLFFLRAAQ